MLDVNILFMKVGLITILDNINFGTILQAYALANKIESFGHKVCFINYWRPNSSDVKSGEF